MSYLGDMKDWQEGAQRALAAQAAESRPDDLDRFEEATLAALIELIEPLEDFPQSDRLLRTIGYARQRKTARAALAARQPDREACECDSDESYISRAGNGECCSLCDKPVPDPDSKGEGE